MFRHLALTRPLAVVDLETTGLDASTARIVEISVLRIEPSAERIHRTRRIHPGMPIPSEAIAIHGIADADVAAAPTFAQIARSLVELLHGCDLCGFNFKRYDLRVLLSEFRRADQTFPMEGRAIVDPMEIFHAFERRDLAAAVRFYLERDHSGAHAAAADVLATAEVLDAMLGRYPELPREVVGLHGHFRSPDSVDPDQFFRRVGDELRFVKGKHRGEPLDAVARSDCDYLRWMLKEDFFDETKAIVAAALAKIPLN